MDFSGDVLVTIVGAMLVGGALAGTIGIRPMLLIGGLGAVSSVIWLLASPIAGTRELATELDL